MHDFSYIVQYMKDGQQCWVWKNVRRGNVSTPFDLQSSKSGGNKTNTKLITILYWETFGKEKKWTIFLAFFFCGGVCLTWGGWKSEEKVKWALLHLWKCFFLLNNSSTMLRTISTQIIWYLDLFQDFFGGGRCVYGGVQVLFRCT